MRHADACWFDFENEIGLSIRVVTLERFYYWILWRVLPVIASVPLGGTVSIKGKQTLVIHSRDSAN